MKLRPRLALSILLTALPVLAVLYWLRSDFETYASEQSLRDFVMATMESGGRELCEASPETFPDSEPDRRMRPGSGLGGPGGPGGPGGGPGRRPGPDGWGDDRMGPGPGGPGGPGSGRRPPPESRRGPPKPIEMYAYDATFVSKNRKAPPFPEELKSAAVAGADFASRPWPSGSTSGIQVAVQMPWKEGPCAWIVAQRLGASPPIMMRSVLWSAVALTGVFLAAVLLAAGSAVRRVIRLTWEVRRSAAGRYAVPIEVTGRDEVAQLATAFNDAGRELRSHLETLEKREETLRSFVANSTHDVMLPLTVLQGHLTAMRNQLDGGLPIDRELVLDSLEEAHYMGGMFHNLGAAVKLEAGESSLHRYPVLLNDLVERVVGRHRPIAMHRGVKLDRSFPDAPLWTEGDVTLIEQAVSNFVHNAVRYNKDGGNVTIVLEEAPRDSASFSIRVLDDGPGLPDEVIARLSERSFRTDEARRRHPEGLGLGLHIAKHVAIAHGFTLEIRRFEAGGLEVELRGPLLGAWPAKDAAGQAPGPGASSTPFRS